MKNECDADPNRAASRYCERLTIRHGGDRRESESAVVEANFEAWSSIGDGGKHEC